MLFGLQGAVKISCARQDPNARNCHGYRKFVKRSVLENPQNGFMANDTIVIRYTIELVVSSGNSSVTQVAACSETFLGHLLSKACQNVFAPTQ